MLNHFSIQLFNFSDLLLSPPSSILISFQLLILRLFHIFYLLAYLMLALRLFQHLFSLLFLVFLIFLKQQHEQFIFFEFRIFLTFLISQEFIPIFPFLISNIILRNSLNFMMIQGIPCIFFLQYHHQIQHPITFTNFLLLLMSDICFIF